MTTYLSIYGNSSSIKTLQILALASKPIIEQGDQKHCLLKSETEKEQQANWKLQQNYLDKEIYRTQICY